MILITVGHGDLVVGERLDMAQVGTCLNADYSLRTILLNRIWIYRVSGIFTASQKPLQDNSFKKYFFFGKVYPLKEYLSYWG